MNTNPDEFDMFEEMLKGRKVVELEKQYLRFIKQSNAIENIHREPSKEEINEFKRFMKLKKITLLQLSKFVAVYQPDAVFRGQEGLNVRVGNYFPPKGGSHVKTKLTNLLKLLNDMEPFEFHCKYEALHPFTDCNGRSGRMLWAWKMKEFPLGFLRHFYYQTLSKNR
jgi:hypothetical protein